MKAVVSQGEGEGEGPSSDCSPHVLSNDHTIRRDRVMEREMEIKAYICLEKRATPKFQAQGMSIQFQDQDMDPYSNLKLSLESLESLEKRATPKFQAQGMSIQFHDQGMDPYSNLKLEIIGGSGKLGVHASAAAVVRASKLKLQSSKPEKEYV